jgi:hypothetical protein
LWQLEFSQNKGDEKTKYELENLVHVTNHNLSF